MIELKSCKHNNKIYYVLNLENLNSLGEQKFNDLMGFMAAQNCQMRDFNGKVFNYKPIINFKGQLLLPRYYHCRLVKYFNDNNIDYKYLSNPKFANKSVSFGPIRQDIWQNNLRVINSVEACLMADKGCILKFDTGNGKTIVLSEIIRRLAKKTVIFVKDSTLLNQMFADLHDNLFLNCESENDCDTQEIVKICNFGNKEFENKEFQCKKCNYIALMKSGITKHQKELLESGNFKILICIINSAIKKPQEYWQDFGLAIYDECHNYGSEERSTILENTNIEYNLGLSANPDSKWNYKILEDWIGPIFDGDKLVEKRQLIGQVNVIKYNGPPDYTKNIKNIKGNLCIAKMIEQFMNDDQRCQIIINIMAEAIKNDQNIFVFAMRNDFLQKIYDLYNAKFPDVPIIILNANSSKDDKSAAKSVARIVLTNYSFSEGLNMPRFRCLILASPFKTNGRQITGRILRKEFDQERIIYDINDVKTAITQQFRERQKIYIDRDFEINHIDAEKYLAN